MWGAVRDRSKNRLTVYPNGTVIQRDQKWLRMYTVPLEIVWEGRVLIKQQCWDNHSEPPTFGKVTMQPLFCRQLRMHPPFQIVWTRS